jgi:hypothetical protein
MMIFRPSDGSWNVKYTGGNQAVLATGWGTLGYLPVATEPVHQAS